MAILPKRNIIEELIESQKVIQRKRHYIGASGIGGKCQRKVWLDFRWAYERTITARTNRIFTRGDLEENRVVYDLENAGMTVTGRQDGFVDDTGHISGHIDGIVTGVPGDDRPHLLEIKTMNDARFKAYIKDGLKTTNFSYYVQMNLYMGFLNLERCIFITTNKNDESRLYKFYDFDHAVFSEYKKIAFDILTSDEMPPAIGGKTWYECKFCDAYKYCHGDQETQVNCRTCISANIEHGGTWSCEKTADTLSFSDQEAACSAYNKSDVYK